MSDGPNKKLPSLLPRDAQGKVSQSDVTRVTQDLVKKLLTEERAHQKDISFSHSRGSKRDVFIFITLAHRNSVDGKIILGEDESRGYERWSDRDPYKYKVYDYIEAPIMANQLPMNRANLGRQLMGCFNTLVNWLARIGAVNGV